MTGWQQFTSARSFPKNQMASTLATPRLTAVSTPRNVHALLVLLPESFANTVGVFLNDRKCRLTLWDALGVFHLPYALATPEALGDAHPSGSTFSHSLRVSARADRCLLACARFKRALTNNQCVTTSPSSQARGMP